MRYTKKIWILLLLFSLLALSGCSGKQRDDGAWKFQIYYLNNSETKVGSYEFATNKAGIREQIDTLIVQSGKMPEKLEYKAPLAMNFQLLDYDLEDGCLFLNMDSSYRNLPVTTEVLVRAALVRTFTQIETVDYVAILTEGEPIMDALGNPVGMMSAAQFIDNAGSAIINEETVKLKLYFADEEGTGLVEETRVVEYNSNISREKLVMEELLKGPAGDNAFPVLNPETKILAISVQDGICYVNLDKTFLTQTYNVSPEATVYAIVDSLAEISGINKVQISADGETDIMYREKYNLKTIFERDLDLLSKKRK